MARKQIPVVTDVIDQQQAGNAQPLNAQYFNGLKEAIEETPYNGTESENGSDIGNTVVSFSDTSSNDNLASGEKIKILFSKIKRWFSRLKALAFKDTINAADINNKQVTNEKIADGAIDDSKVSNSANISQSKVANLVSDLKKITDRLDDLGFNTGSVTGISNATLTRYGKYARLQINAGRGTTYLIGTMSFTAKETTEYIFYYEYKSVKLGGTITISDNQIGILFTGDEEVSYSTQIFYFEIK